MLDELTTGADWKKYYECEPNDFSGNEQQKSLVIGGEACMWSDFVDDSNILQRIFPRVCAAAEKLWSQSGVGADEAESRLEEHTCRMISRGILAQPSNGPGFCPGVPLVEGDRGSGGSSRIEMINFLLLLSPSLVLYATIFWKQA